MATIDTRIDVTAAMGTKEVPYVICNPDDIFTVPSSSEVQKGGALYVESAAGATGEKPTFLSNSVTTTDGMGGAVYTEGTLSLNNAFFESNSATSQGGAIGSSGGDLTISDTNFISNSALNGGAIYAQDTKVSLSGCVTFNGNTATEKGGAIYLKNSTLTVSGDVYLSAESDTIYLSDDASQIEWIVGTAANGYVSDFSYIEAADKAKHQFTIDATSLAKWDTSEQGEHVLSETPAPGRSCVLAGSAINTSDFGNFILKYASSTYGEVSTTPLTLNKAYYDSAMGLYYSLTLNSSNELELSTIKHIVVMDGCTYTMDNGDNYNWAGMEKHEDDGAIFEVQTGGTLESQFNTTVRNGYASGNGGAIYNKGTATLKGVTFEGNTADGKGGAIYNAGTLNITGSIALETDTDTIVSEGDNAVINWALDTAVALTSNTDFSISDFSRVSSDDNSKGFTITLNENSASQMSGAFKLASNAAKGIGVAVSDMSGIAGSPTLSVTPTDRLKALSSPDNKIYYELRLDDNDDLYFTVDKALFLDDSWGDNETDLAAWFHGNAITGGSTLDGTFFNNSKDAQQQASYANSTVIVYGRGLDHSSVENLQSKYTLQAEVKLSAEHTWVNTGTAVRDAVVNWDLTGDDLEETDICINGFQYYGNAATKIDKREEYFVNQTITLKKDQAYGNYVLAAGDLSDALTDETGKYDFTLVTSTDLTGEKLMLNDVTEYNDRYYSLYVDDNSTADVTDDKLVLGVDTEAKLTIRVAHISVMYDGQNHKASYTVVGENLLQNDDELQVTLSNTEGLLNAGSIDTLSVSSYQVMNAAGADVTGNYKFNDSVAGSLEVTKRPITLKSEDFTKEYDGTALVGGGTITDVTAGETDKGYVSGEEFNYSFSGSQLFVGTSKNKFSVSNNAAALVSNYEVSKQSGNLSVTPRTAPLTITVKDQTKLYDGTAEIEAAEKDVTYTVDGELAYGDTLTVTLVNTNAHAGTYADGITATYKIMHGDTDVTQMYANVTVDAGNLTVNQRSVTLTSGSAEKDCDGMPLTNDTVTVTGDGWLQGEEAAYDVTGSQTDIGVSRNFFTYELNDSALAADYAVTEVYGTLTVNSVNPMVIKEGGSVTIREDSAYEQFAVGKDAEVTVAEGMTLEIGSLALEEGSSFRNDGTAEISALNVSGKDAAISGNLMTADTITLAEGAELGMNKIQYDLFLAGTQFESAEGKLIVSESVGNALRTQDVDALMAKENVTDVAFRQDLIDVSTLNFKSAKKTAIGFRDGYGTTKSDTIRFYEGTNLTFGSEGNEINLYEGSNTIQIDKNATTAIQSNLTNVSTVKAASGSTVTTGDIDFQDGRSASLKAEGTYFEAGTITGTDKKTTVTIGKGTEFVSEAVTLGEKSDRITANSGSTVYVGTTEGEVFTGAAIEFNDGSDTLNAKGSRFVAGTIDFGSGNDKLTVGKSSFFAASTVSGADTIKLGAYSTTQIEGAISGTKKLTISNGKEGQIATLKASAVTGTDANDSYSLGNWNDVDFASLDLGDGNDTLKIGSYADVDINSLDFGDGTKDKLTIGKGATLSVNTLDVDSLDSLSMSTGATLYLGSESYDAAMETEWGKKYGDQISKLA